MKIKKWIAAALAASLILAQFALGEGVNDWAETLPDHPDISEEADLPETEGKGDTEEIQFSTELKEESMIFVFQVTEQKSVSSDEDETELADEVSGAQADAEAEDEVTHIPDADTEAEDKVTETLDSVTETEDEVTEAPDADTEAEDEVPGIPETEAEAGVLEQKPVTDVPEENSAAQAEPEMDVTNDALSVPKEAGLDTLNDASEGETAIPTKPEVYLAGEIPGTSEEPEAEAEPDALIGLPEGELLVQEETQTDAYEEGEESALAGTAESNPTAGDPESTGAAAVISGLKVTPVETNDEYRQMTFSFTAEGREYTCLVTGLAETGTNSEAAWQQLATDIAESFLAGEIFTLSEAGAATQYDLKLDLIDAEKINKSKGNDSNICWAASTADMLEYAGWNKAADEDAVFQQFREEFNNRGGYQSMAISWYLNGVNPYQASYSGSGNVAYGQNLDGAAQQQHAGTGGYWKDYAASEVSEEYDDQLPEQLEEAADKLAEGYGVGVGSYFYRDQETIAAGHALTVFGYIREKLEEAAAAIRALFISDSDNRANGSKTNPADYPDEYIMYQVTPFENSSMSSVQLENYNTSYTTVIGIVSTLAPQQTAKAETEGTGNAVQNANLTPTGLRIEDADGVSITETEAGTTITMGSEFKNQSYKSLPKDAVIRYTVKIYRNGKLVDEVEKSVKIDNSKGLHPNKSVEDSLQITLEKNGEYTFETQVKEITTAAGEPIPEAYVRDNLYRGTARLTITGGTEEDPEEEEPNEPDPSEESQEKLLETVLSEKKGSGEKPEEAGETIYTLTAVLATDTEFVLDFDAAAAAPESFTRMRNRKTGGTVDPENYRITRGEDGGFSIAFEESFIRSLKPGKNDFVLTWTSGRVLIRIIIM